MKKTLSVQIFKDFIEKIAIVKKCRLSINNKATIELNNGNKVTILLSIANEGYPKQILDIIANIKDSNLYCVIIAPYISEQTSYICKDARVGYLDLVGNCYIACDCLYIDIKGNRNIYPSKRGLKSIYERSSVVSSIILRIMLADINKTWKMKDLANEARCSIGQVAKVKEFLLKQAYIEQTSDGIKITKPGELLSDWASVYGNNNDEMITCYSLDNISTIEAKLAKMKDDIRVECILTGLSGGSRYQPVVRYQKVYVYVDDIDVEKVIDYLGLKEVETGANIVLINTYNDCIKYDAKILNGNKVASLVQLYLDCMNIKGRGEEMAQAILEREICK